MSVPLTRRRLLSVGAAGLALCAAPVSGGAHTPYRQWVVYRKKHLLVGCHRDDDAGYALAKGVATELAQRLPASNARVARAPSPVRLAGLLATDQLELAVFDAARAPVMAGGEDRFASVGPVDLSSLVRLTDDYVLFAHARFKADHAELVAHALLGTPLAPLGAQTDPPLPWHPAVPTLLRDAAAHAEQR